MPPDGARVSFRFNLVAGDQDLAWHPGHHELPNESEEGGLIAMVLANLALSRHARRPSKNSWRCL
jgi:hypothetical protein